MSIFNIQIDSVTKEIIEGLIDNVSESTQVDFKKEIHIRKDEDKKEFLADVVSFASTMGGDLIYGISENKGVAQAFHPIEIPDLDQFKLSLSSIIRDGIEPRINFRIKEFLFEDKYIVLLRIFKLFPGPPMITYKNTSKFFSRGALEKYQMNYLQIRNAFNSAATINESFKEFRNDRINHYLSATDGNDSSKPFILFHIYPMNEVNFEINNIPYTEITKALYPINPDGSGYKFNIDGFLMLSHLKSPTENKLTQNQLFYNGAIEIYDDRILERRVHDPLIISVELLSVENKIIRSFLQVYKFYNSNSIFPPFICNLSLINVGNSLAYIQNSYDFNFTKNFRQNLIFIESIINPNSTKPINSLRQILDDLWRAYGISKSPSFNDEGDFIRTPNFNISI